MKTRSAAGLMLSVFLIGLTPDPGVCGDGQGTNVNLISHKPMSDTSREYEALAFVTKGADSYVFVALGCWLGTSINKTCNPANQTGNLVDVWKVTDPTNPVLVDTIITNNWNNDIEVSPDGNYLYVALSDVKADATNNIAGIAVYNIQNPAASTLVGKYFQNEAVHTITVWGDTLLLNDNLNLAAPDSGRLHFVNMAPIDTGGTPTHIGDWWSTRLTSTYKRAAHDSYVATVGTTPYAFISYNRGGGTQVINLSNLSGMTENVPDTIATFRPPEQSPNTGQITHSSFLSSAGYLYICYEDLTGDSFSDSGGVHIRQFRENPTPRLFGSSPMWDAVWPGAGGGYLRSVHDPWINGTRLYLAHYGHGVRALNIASPNQTSPVQLGHYITGDNEGLNGANDPFCSDVIYAMIGGKGYVLACDMRTGLWILDSEPTGGTVKAPLTLKPPYSPVLTSDMTITSTGSLTIRNGTSVTLNNNKAIYIPSGSTGTFIDTATWSPKDVAINSGTTLKGHTATIQRAISLASANSYPTVDVASGPYSEALTLQSSVNVIKRSGTVTVTTPASGAAAVISGKSNITMDGINLTGVPIGLDISNSSNITVKNATITHGTAGSTNACIKILTSGTTINVISDSLNGNASNGLYLDDGDPVLEHCAITGNDYGVRGINNSNANLDIANTEDNTKNNKIYENTSYNAHFSTTPGVIDAQYIWWGASDCVPAKIFHGGPGDIAYVPCRNAWFAKLVAAQQTPTAEEAARALNEQGLALYRSGSYAEARTVFEQVMRDYPQTREAHVAVEYAANTYGVQGQFAEAAQYLDGLTWITEPELKARVQHVALRWLVLSQAHNTSIQRADALVTTYPSSYYAPFALLHNGVTQLYNLQDTTAARATFQSIVDRYPTSEAVPEAQLYLSITGQPPAKPSSRPSSFSLVGNAPNPFNPQTTIYFTLPQPASVKLTIYNTLGQPVRQLAQTLLPAGAHAVTWDGRNDQGKEMASGVYLYRLVTPTYTESRKMTLVR